MKGWVFALLSLNCLSTVLRGGVIVLLMALSQEASLCKFRL